MRTAFINALTELAKNDKDVVLITGDLGFGTFEPFEERFPGQYFNVGIAEQSMIGIASGLAKAGKKVFVYSIGNFVTLRCLEQIRNDACYHNLNVNLVCQGGGFTYGALGMSHHATEDLAIMRVLPEVTVVAPSNSTHTEQAVKSVIMESGVSYLRLEKDLGENETSTPFKLGFPDYKSSNSDVLVIAIGSIVSEAFKAQTLLTGIKKISVLDFHTLSQYDESYVFNTIKKYKLIITLEEHQKVGGLGSVISDLIVEKQLCIKLKKMAINNKLISEVGNQSYLRKVNGLDAITLVNLIKSELEID